MKFAILLLAIASFPAAAQFSTMPAQRMIQNPRQQQPTGNGAISGNVVNEVTREPVKKAQVALNGPVSLSAVTDDAGHFAFKLLPPGPYILQVAEGNFSPQRPRLGSQFRSNVSLAADEQKSGVVLSVIPGTAISGRLTDEEGLPLLNCNVTAMQFDFNQGSRTLGARSVANTNEKGEYRIANLAEGKYLVLARCHQSIPLPHAFIRRNSGVEVPTMSYVPQFYPGTPDVHAATKLTAAGSELSGIDLRLSPGGGITLRGKVGSADPEGMNGNIQMMLESRDPLQRGLGMTGARFDRQTGEFRFDRVRPGSYDVIANNLGEGRRYYARVPIEIGSAPPDPLVVMLAPAMTLTGSITQEGEANIPLESVHISLSPMEHYFGGPQPNSPVQKDGTFSFTGVLPGRWLLTFGGAPGYVKSVSLNNRESASPVLEIPAGAAGPMKVVISSAMAQVDGTVSGIPADSGRVFGILWRVQDGPSLRTPGQMLGFDPQGKFTHNHVQPGKYAVCAVGVEPWTLMQNPAIMDALKSRCEMVDLSPAGRTSVQVRFIPTRDLETILASLEN